MKVELIQTEEEFHAIGASWNEIVRSAQVNPLFNSWEWLYTWWTVYSKSDYALKLLLLTDDHSIGAIAPFFIKTVKRHRQLLFIGTGEQEEEEVCSEFLDIICVKETYPIAEKLIFEWLLSNSKLWDSMSFRDLAADSFVVTRLLPRMADKFKIRKEYGRYRYLLHLDEVADKAKNGTKPSFMSSTKRKLRKLDTSHLAENGIIEHAAEVESALTRLIELHQTKWQDQDQLGAFYSDNFKRFHQKITKLFFDREELKLHTLTIAKNCIAILYNFRIRETEYFYQSGYDHNFAPELSIGSLLHLVAIEQATAEGLKYYDFMGDKEGSYKSRFHCRPEPLVAITLFNNTPHGLFAYVQLQFQELASIYLRKLRARLLPNRQKPEQPV